MQWKPFSAITTAVLAVLAGFILQSHHNAELATARAETRLAIAIGSDALDIASNALAFADSVAQVADSIESVAEAQAHQASLAAQWAFKVADDADVLALSAPDTCAPALAAMRASRDAEHAAAENWRIAYQTQVEATARLWLAGDTLANVTRDVVIPAVDTLAAAAGRLVDASGPSFWRAIKPEVVLSAGITHGVDIITGRRATVLGVQAGLGWEFSL